ncbi:fungal-specific transcription factor domain-containing protein [Fusarium avenaceum]|nr:fungal-specific transcription factor domain-containing protein [Fusarium avenaceum]
MDAPKRKRTGCGECRRKKAKCDEKKPVCSRCMRFPHLCLYELNVRHIRVQTLRSGPSQKDHHDGKRNSGGSENKQLQSHVGDITTAVHNFRHISRATRPDVLSSSTFSDVYNIPRDSSYAMNPLGSDLAIIRPTSFPNIRSTSHRFYLYHFIESTAAIYFPLHPDTFLRFIISMVEISHCMFGALLVASSSHYFRLKDDQKAHIDAIEATIQTLSSLTEAITTTQTRNQILATSLMLATTCLCAGETHTYRQHLNGALKIVTDGSNRQSPHQQNPDQLWLFSLKWLTQLLLMNRLSGLPLPSQQRRGGIDWKQLLVSMPESNQIDSITGLSSDLVILLDGICELSDQHHPKLDEVESSSEVSSTDEIREIAAGTNQSIIRIFETRLVNMRDGAIIALTDARLVTELECSHHLFVNSTLLCLYKRIYGLSKYHYKIQITVDALMYWLQKIDKHSQANIPLIWPLLAAGCEASTNAQRSFIASRMAVMTEHGLGNCKIVLKFMEDYWRDGNDMRWDMFAKSIGVDLILF